MTTVLFPVADSPWFDEDLGRACSGVCVLLEVSGACHTHFPPLISWMGSDVCVHLVAAHSAAPADWIFFWLKTALFLFDRRQLPAVGCPPTTFCHYPMAVGHRTARRLSVTKTAAVLFLPVRDCPSHAPPPVFLDPSLSQVLPCGSCGGGGVCAAAGRAGDAGG